MHARQVLVGLFAALAAATVGLAAHESAGSMPFVVHEWGTFLSVQGSDGVTLGGMVDSDEILPDFVESANPSSYMRMLLTSKMETPVTYFYTDAPRTVQVRIDMPKGLLTHWYPLVQSYGPNPSNKPLKPENSFLEWRNVQLIPTPAPDRPFTPVADNLNWRFARETDAALVKIVGHTFNERTKRYESRDRYEKFLFYRGLGAFTMPLSVKSTQSHLALVNESASPLDGLFAVQIEKDSIRFGSAGSLAGHGTRDESLSAILGKSLPVEQGVPLIKQAVASALIEAGLYEKEATAMVNTWERSYFRTEGLRVLYLIPRSAVDSAIPIQIKPAPDQLVRVMVGRVEVLTPQRERQIETFISQLGSADFHVRDEGTLGLSHLGRIGEPALRRVAKTTQDPEVRARVAQLIQKFESH
jgi:hypothetical protein